MVLELIDLVVFGHDVSSQVLYELVEVVIFLSQLQYLISVFSPFVVELLGSLLSSLALLLQKLHLVAEILLRLLSLLELLLESIAFVVGSCELFAELVAFLVVLAFHLELVLLALLLYLLHLFGEVYLHAAEHCAELLVVLLQCL
jgi:hypothetical protein